MEWQFGCPTRSNSFHVHCHVRMAESNAPSGRVAALVAKDVRPHLHDGGGTIMVHVASLIVATNWVQLRKKIKKKSKEDGSGFSGSAVRMFELKAFRRRSFKIQDHSIPILWGLFAKSFQIQLECIVQSSSPHVTQVFGAYFGLAASLALGPAVKEIGGHRGGRQPPAPPNGPPVGLPSASRLSRSVLASPVR